MGYPMLLIRYLIYSAGRKDVTTLQQGVGVYWLR